MPAPVVLVPSDPAFAEAFRGEAAVLRGALGDALVDAQHVGSTAVPGLPAKPIVDILAIARSLAAADARRAALEAAGFVWRGEYGIPGRRYLVRPGPAEDRTHVHLFALGDPQVWRHLAFRDALRVDPALAAEYERLKREWAFTFRDDRAAYAAAKTPFVEQVLRRAATELFHIAVAPPPIAPGPEGFVHLSSRAQVLRTANRFFRGRPGLLLLRVDPTGLDLRWEWNDGDLFPHLYAALPAGAVTGEWAFEPAPDGTFVLPQLDDPRRT